MPTACEKTQPQVGNPIVLEISYEESNNNNNTVNPYLNIIPSNQKKSRPTLIGNPQ